MGVGIVETDRLRIPISKSPHRLYGGRRIHPHNDPAQWAWADLVRELPPPWEIPDVARPVSTVAPLPGSQVGFRIAPAIKPTAARAMVDPEPAHILAGRWLLVYRALGRLSAHIMLHRADMLAKLHQEQIHRSCGFAAFSDFVREVLKTSPRTARRQLTLGRVTPESPHLREAFLDGRLSLCKVLALQPVHSTESLPFWIDLGERLTVRELEAKVRGAREEAPHQGISVEEPDVGSSEAPATRVVFPAPVSTALVWEEGIRVARRVLGWKAPQYICVESILAEAEAALAREHLRGIPSGVLPQKWPTGDSGNEGAIAFAAISPDPQQQEPVTESPTHPGPARPPSPSRPLAPEAAHAIRQTLALVEREIQSLTERLTATGSSGPPIPDPPTLGSPAPGPPIPGPQTPGSPTPGSPTRLPQVATAPRSSSRLGVSLEGYRALDHIDRQIRLLQALLVREVWTHHLHHALGCSNLQEFAEVHLGLSERAARIMVSEAYLFDDEPRLAHPFREGQIGLTQAQLIYRVALPSTLEEYIARAQVVTLRQFEREVHFLERLAELAPEIWGDHRGALPDPGLERALLEGIAQRGGDPEAVLKDLRSRGLGDGTPPGFVPAHTRPGVDAPPAVRPTHGQSGGERGAGADPGRDLHLDLSQDPAVHQRLMTRLETLLEIFVLQGYSDPAHGRGQAAGPDRQMLASEHTTPVNGISRAHPAGEANGTSRATEAGRWTTISFLAPPNLLEAWNFALHRLRSARGPLPSWACAVLLVQHALDEWLRHDPDTVPTEHVILERDEYLCHAPGCSSRRNLEVHHIQFRSQGGTDHEWNKVTLCHAHHHHVLHAGNMRVSGNAPDGLVWELGTADGCAPLMTLQGDRFVRGGSDLPTIRLAAREEATHAKTH